MKEHAVDQPSDLFHFQAHAYRWQEKHLCNSCGAPASFSYSKTTTFALAAGYCGYPVQTSGLV